MYMYVSPCKRLRNTSFEFHFQAEKKAEFLGPEGVPKEQVKKVSSLAAWQIEFDKLAAQPYG